MSLDEDYFGSFAEFPKFVLIAFIGSVSVMILNFLRRCLSKSWLKIRKNEIMFTASFFSVEQWKTAELGDITRVQSKIIQSSGGAHHYTILFRGKEGGGAHLVPTPYLDPFRMLEIWYSVQFSKKDGIDEEEDLCKRIRAFYRR